MEMTRAHRWIVALALAAAALLAGCGTPSATVRTSRGEDLMLLGYDPVAYFNEHKAVRGVPTLAYTSVEGRTYYFASETNRRFFESFPGKFEPEYGGFCANGAAYNVKLGSDPTQFVVRGLRLFIFGDVLGKEMWLLDPDTNIRHADALWRDMKATGWRWQSLKGWTFAKVPWYRDGKGLMDEWRAKHPGESLSYDTGGTLRSLLKYPGWRAREGFSQPALGVPGEPDGPAAAR